MGETMLLVCGCMYKAYKAYKKALKVYEVCVVYESCINGEYVKHALREQEQITKLEKHINHALAYLYNLADFLGFDLNKHILAKMQYNITREYLHGKAY